MSCMLVTSDIIPSSAQGIRYQNVFQKLISANELLCLTFSTSLQLTAGSKCSCVKPMEAGWLYRYLNRLLKRIVFPDAYILFILSYQKNISQIMQNKAITSIIIGMTPFSLMLLARQIKRITPTVILVADMSDPFSFNMGICHNMLKTKIARFIERKSFPYFDHIVVLNPSIRNKYQAIYPEIANKFTVIEQAADIDFIHEVNTSPHSHNQPFIFLYAGGFYKSGRNPKYLYSAFESFTGKAALHIYGDIRRNIRPSQSENILFHKAVSKTELEKISAEADALVLVDNEWGYQVPGKTLETLAINKPIIFIYNNADSPSLEYVKAATGIVWAKNNTENIKVGIEKILNREYEPHGFDYSKYTWDLMSQKYNKLIETGIG